MSAADPIYYLRALLGAPIDLCKPPISAPLFHIVGHFYFQAEDQPTAGALAHDYCRFQGLEFKEYLALPSIILREHIGLHEQEHLEAFELASVDGEAAVISLVFGKLRALELPPGASSLGAAE